MPRAGQKRSRGTWSPRVQVPTRHDVGSRGRPAPTLHRLRSYRGLVCRFGRCCRVLQSTLAGLHGPLGIGRLGGGWKAAIHPDDLPRLLDTFQRARESCQAFVFEGRLRRFDGEFRRFLMRGEPVQDERGCVVTWHGTNIDLEDRARAEDALRLSAEGLRLIVDTIPGLIAINTADGKLELLNQSRPGVLRQDVRGVEELGYD